MKDARNRCWLRILISRSGLVPRVHSVASLFAPLHSDCPGMPNLHGSCPGCSADSILESLPRGPCSCLNHETPFRVRPSRILPNVALYLSFRRGTSVRKYIFYPELKRLVHPPVDRLRLNGFLYRKNLQQGRLLQQGGC